MARFNFTDVLREGGEWIRTDLRQLMNKQVDVNGRGYKPLATSTITQKMRDGFGTVARMRMFRTKDFWNNAFRSIVIGNVLTFFVSEELHGRNIKSMRKTIDRNSGLGTAKSEKQLKKTHARLAQAEAESFTYQQLADWQLGASKFFPSTPNEINNLQSVQRLTRALKESADKQAKWILDTEIQKLNAVNSLKK